MSLLWFSVSILSSLTSNGLQSKPLQLTDRAPELWECPSNADIDERTDIWSLGCTLYAMMYGKSPFEDALNEAEENKQLVVTNPEIKWAPGPDTPYPESLCQFVVWMLQPQPAVRPHIDDIIIHVDKLIAKYSN